MQRPAHTFETFVIVEAKHQPVHFGFCLVLDAAIDEGALRAALAPARRAFPLLAARVLQDGAGRYLVDTEGAAPFPVTPYAGTELPWTAVLDAELRKPFSLEAGPATRFALRPLARGTELYCVFHHAFADGRSAVGCLEVLLEALGGVHRPRPPHPERGLLPSLRPEVLAELSRRPPPSTPPSPPLDPAELRRRAAEPYRAPAAFAVRPWALSGAETARLLEASRAAGVTVHAALGAAWLTATAELLGGPGAWRRTIQFPVDLRPYFVEEARDAWGVFFGIVTAEIDCAAGRPLAAVAREIKDALDALRRERKDLEEPFQYRDLLRDVPHPDEVIAGFPARPAAYDFSLSNLGRLPLATAYGALRVEALWGPTFSAVNGERVIGVNTHGGILRMTDIWDPSRCDSAAYDGIRERARARLAAFLEPR